MYLFKYKDLIRNIIIDYKFNDKSYLYKTLKKIIINNKKVCDFIKSYDIIIPVPINQKRKMERGYNQTLLIAQELVKDIPCIELNKNIIIKHKNIKTQSLLSKNQRRKNVVGAFKLKNEVNLENKKMLIFDDVFTTGSTVNECAKILKQAGAINVGVLTIAKD